MVADLRNVILSAAFLLVVSCSTDPGPPVTVSDLHVFAPLPGSSAGVAYMVIENRSGAAVTIRGARSPQFDRVEMHETRMEDGIMRMRPVGELLVGSGDDAVFEQGGRHFMLIGAKPDVAAGMPVTLEITLDEVLLSVSATLQARIPSQ